MPDVLDPTDPNDAVEIAAREASGVPQNHDAVVPGILYPALADGTGVRVEYDVEVLRPAYDVHHYPGFHFPAGVLRDAYAPVPMNPHPGVAPYGAVEWNGDRVENPAELEEEIAEFAEETADLLAIALDVPREMLDQQEAVEADPVDHDNSGLRLYDLLLSAYTKGWYTPVTHPSTFTDWLAEQVREGALRMELQ